MTESGDILDIKQIESFIEVVNKKSFSRAAEKLFMTQPTITAHIQSLEAELDTVLLNRTNKKVTMTDAGNLFFQHAINIVNIKETAEYELKEYKGKIEGNLEICSSSIPSQYILPYLLKKFTDQFPNVTFSINQKNSKNVIDDIINGQINYGIVGGKYDYDCLEYIDFFDDHLTLVASAGKKNFGPAHSQLDLDVILKEKIILREEGSSSRLLIEETLKNKKIKLNQLNIISLIKDNETIKQLVALDVGISFISEIAIKKEVDLELISPYPIKNLKFNRKFYFVYHKNRYLSPVDQAFRDFIIRNAGNLNL